MLALCGEGRLRASRGETSSAGNGSGGKGNGSGSVGLGVGERQCSILPPSQIIRHSKNLEDLKHF